MSVIKWYQLSALSLAVAFSFNLAALAESEAFSKLTFKQAKEQAQKEGKILIVDFMATWCPPCKKMDSTTWVDPKVTEWVKQNAIAVQIDVDKDAETTSALNVDSMPTLVLFKPDGGGKEFTRESGYQSPEELLQWLSNTKSGKNAEQVKEETSNAADGGPWDRIGKAFELMKAKKYAEAQDEYYWLWTNLRNDDPIMGELRQKVVPIQVNSLVKRFPEAKGKWLVLRDAAEKEKNRSDWLSLNMMLDDNERTLAWFDKAKVDATERQTFESLGPLLEYPLFAGKRYDDAAKYLYPKPIDKIQAYHKTAQSMMKPRPDTEFAKGFDPFPSMVLLVYGAYVGAGKDAEAKKIYDECIRLDDTTTMKEMLENVSKSMLKARASDSSVKKQ